MSEYMWLAAIKKISPVLIGSALNVLMVVHENKKTGKKTPLGLIVAKFFISVLVGASYFHYAGFLTRLVSDDQNAHLLATLVAATLGNSLVHTLRDWWGRKIERL